MAKLKLQTKHDMDLELTHLIADPRAQRMQVHGEDVSWPIVSGPWGNGSAPRGAYLMEKPVALAVKPGEDEKSIAPFRDPAGFAWFAHLTPLFQTDRTGLGIHPDGNVPGTEGCIGVVMPDTRPVYEVLCKLPGAVILLVL